MNNGNDPYPHLRPFMHRAAAQPGALTFVLAAVAGTLLLVSVSSPGGGPLWLFLAVMGAGPMSVAWWSVRVALMVVARFKRPTTPPLAQRGWIRVFAAPLMGIVAIALSATHLPLHARWLLSRSEMNALAARARASTEPIEVHACVGLYYVDAAAMRTGNEVEIISSSFDLFVQTGRFVRSPDHPIVPGRGRTFVTPLGGHWYATIAD